MNRFFVNTLIVSVLAMGTVSCQALGNMFGEEPVITTPSQLEEGEVGTPIPVEQLPEEIKEKLPEGTQVIIAEKDQLKEEAAYVPLGEPEGVDVAGIVQALFAALSAFIPGLAAWEGVVSLFSKRKRTQYAKAFTSIMPFDRKVDIGGAVTALAAAIGAAHSTEASRLVAEADPNFGHGQQPEETA